MFEPVPVREAVINMLVHNDYTHGYTPVAELFSDRLELTSHGGLPKDYLKICSSKESAGLATGG